MLLKKTFVVVDSYVVVQNKVITVFDYLIFLFPFEGTWEWAILVIKEIIIPLEEDGTIEEDMGFHHPPWGSTEVNSQMTTLQAIVYRTDLEGTKSLFSTLRIVSITIKDRREE